MCDRSGPVDNSNRYGSLSFNEAWFSGWGSKTEQARTDENFLDLHHHHTNYSKSCICKNCEDQLGHLKKEFMDCDNLIKNIEKESVQHGKVAAAAVIAVND
jgi:hypothetical protein